MTDVVALAAELLAIQSFTRDEGAVIDFIARWQGRSQVECGLSKRSPRVGETFGPPRWGWGDAFYPSRHCPSVHPASSRRATVCTAVAPRDAKGIAAAMLVAADLLAVAGEERVDVLLVVGEEKKGPMKLGAANNLAATSRYLINGEPTESRLASGCKGSLRFMVRTRGREAHSAYPELGRSAIEPLLIRLLPTIWHNLHFPSDPVLGETTVNIGTIRWGRRRTSMPAHAESELMLRLMSDVAPVKEMIEAWAQAGLVLRSSSIRISLPNAFIQFLDSTSYRFRTPRIFRSWGVGGTPLLFGPGSIHVAHTPDEYIDDQRAARGSVDTYVQRLS